MYKFIWREITATLLSFMLLRNLRRSEKNMDGELKSLPKDTVRLIGSSQVITSVYSVVKELVENSLDSDATTAEVKLENYGLDKVEVRDNGCGIKQANIPFVAKRYHTSKISSFDDLENLCTYGFRGEALGSLCSVSSLAITSKTQEESVSFTYSFDQHGNIVTKQASHLGQGTTVTACHLFKNLPVRRQFYNTSKKKKEELKRVEDLLMVYGIVKPVVRLVLKHGKEIVWQKNGVQDARTALLGILGRNMMSQMEYKVKSFENPQMALQCYLPQPKSDVNITSRSTNDRCLIAVNSRPVQVKEIEKSFKQYYCGCMGVEGRYPIFYLALNISTSTIDVNVDPNKTRIMIQEQKMILEHINTMLEELYGSLGKKEIEDDKDSNIENSPTANCLSSRKADDTYQDAKGSGVKNGRVAIVVNKTGHKVKFKDAKSDSDDRTIFTGLETKVSFHKWLNSDEETSTSSAELSSFEANIDKHGKPNCSGKVNEVGLNSNHDLKENQVDPDGGLQSLGQKGKVSFDFLDDDLEEFLKSQDSVYRKNSGEVISDCPEGFSGACMDTENIGHEKRNVSNIEGNDKHNFELIKDHESIGNTCKSSLTDRSVMTDVESNIIASNNKENRSQTMEDTVKQKERMWSAGNCVRGTDGNILQPVTLLTSNSVSNTNKRSHAQMNDDVTVCTPPSKRKSLSLQSNQPRLYEVIGKSPNDKYSLGFTSFSREERPKVIEENPDLLYDDITKLVCQKWDRLSGEDKKQYEDSGKVHIQQLKKKVQEKQFLAKKVKKVEEPSNIKERLLSSTNASSSTTPVASVKVKFSLQRLRELYQSGIGPSQPQSSPSMFLIGPLKFYNGWVCLHDNKLKVINPHRVEETLLFHELMENHVIASTKLDQVIKLNESVLGESLLQVLVNMIPTDSYQTYVYIEDKRITSNGLKIRCHVDESNCPVLELDGKTQSIPTFGVQDLKEVVKLIHDTSATTLQQCRPLKIIYYLQGEAVRMVRKRPLTRNLDDMQDILQQMTEKLPSDCVKCLHEKLFLHTIYDMHDLPLSQCTQG